MQGCAQKVLFRCHSFEAACADLDIQHRLTKPRHPWTNGQVERMNRTIKDATVRRFHYDGHDQLRQHLADFVAAYNFARRLKTLRGLTPYEAICKAWTDEPFRFMHDPHHQIAGPNRGCLVPESRDARLRCVIAGILHGSARTTPRVQTELQKWKVTTSTLDRLYGLRRTTVAKWLSRSGTAKRPMGLMKDAARS